MTCTIVLHTVFRVCEIVLSLARHFKLFTGHLIRFYYGSSPDIFKFRWTYPAIPPNFAYSGRFYEICIPLVNNPIKSYQIHSRLKILIPDVTFNSQAIVVLMGMMKRDAHNYLGSDLPGCCSFLYETLQFLPEISHEICPFHLTFHAKCAKSANFLKKSMIYKWMCIELLFVL